VVNTTDPTAVNLAFPDRSRFSLKYLLNYSHEAKWTPFQTHYFSENLVVPGIKPGASRFVGRNSEHWTSKAVLNKIISFYLRVGVILDRKVIKGQCRC
jgi:hypothetical protein